MFIHLYSRGDPHAAKRSEAHLKMHFVRALKKHPPSRGNVRINPGTQLMAVNSTANLLRGLLLMHNQGARHQGACVGLPVFENLKTMMRAPMQMEGKGAIAEGC